MGPGGREGDNNNPVRGSQIFKLTRDIGRVGNEVMCACRAACNQARQVAFCSVVLLFNTYRPSAPSQPAADSTPVHFKA